jgi:protein involved in polysaccharide export with SLBB domain
MCEGSELEMKNLLVAAFVVLGFGAQEPRVWVAGSVTSPGTYAYVEGMTAGDAIDKAGGIKHPDFSSCTYVVRQVDGRRQRTAATRDTGVRPDDVVDVLEVNDGGQTRPCPAR